MATAIISNNLKRETIILLGVLSMNILYGVFIITTETTRLIMLVVGLGLSLAPIFPTIISSAERSITQYDYAASVLLGTAAFGGIVFPFGIGRVAETLGIKRGMILIGVAMVAFLVTTIINFFIKKESSSSSLIIYYNLVLLRLGLRI